MSSSNEAVIVSSVNHFFGFCSAALRRLMVGQIGCLFSAVVLITAGADAAFGQSCSSVSVQNTTYPAMSPSFYVGNKGTLTISGTPNGQITVTEYDNGVEVANNAPFNAIPPGAPIRAHSPKRPPDRTWNIGT